MNKWCGIRPLHHHFFSGGNFHHLPYPVYRFFSLDKTLAGHSSEKLSGAALKVISEL
jgi:hypothetical protein